MWLTSIHIHLLYVSLFLSYYGSLDSTDTRMIKKKLAKQLQNSKMSKLVFTIQFFNFFYGFTFFYLIECFCIYGSKSILECTWNILMPAKYRLEISGFIVKILVLPKVLIIMILK